jgi:DNA-binding transcriptional MerR regulator
MTASFYSIKDLENLTGIKAHTIRMWEQRYGIIKPERTDSNIRLYGADELKMMLNIALLNNNGVKISRIAQMSEKEVNEKVLETIQKNSSYEDQINALTVAMIDLEEDQFEKIMSSNILQYGFEKTMINVIYPFLSRIGTLWLSASINPAQEHFITNLIRQKLIVAVDGYFEPNRTHSKKFLLFLPEGELHEISLLFCAYLIKSRGNKVIYLGQSLPLRDVIEVHKIHNAEYLVCIITANPYNDQTQNYVNNLAASFPNQHILLSGYQVVGQDIQTPDNATIFTNINQMIDFIDECGKRK